MLRIESQGCTSTRLEELEDVGVRRLGPLYHTSVGHGAGFIRTLQIRHPVGEHGRAANEKGPDTPAHKPQGHDHHSHLIYLVRRQYGLKIQVAVFTAEIFKPRQVTIIL